MKAPVTPLSPFLAQMAFPEGLLEDLRIMIDQSRQSIVSTVNAGLTLLYWNVGSRIRA